MPRKHAFQIKRAYEAPAARDGVRFLVDRLWPRGIRKEALAGVPWLREAAPSQALRKWFGHEPAKWAEFRRRYRVELETNAAALKPLQEAVRTQNVTLLFAAKDPELNQAAVLREFLEEKR